MVTARRMAAYHAEMAGRPLSQGCPECGGTGYVKVAEVSPIDPRFGKIEHCSICNKDRRAKWLAENCGLEPEEIEKAYSSQFRLGNWSPDISKTYSDQRRAVAEMLAKVKRNRAGLITLYGDYGSGKTFTLQIAVNEARADLIESFYAPFSLILSHLRGLVAQKADSSTFMQRLFDVPVLAIDEVTRFNETEWAMEQLFVLVDTRYRRRHSHLTLFATNDDPQVLLSTGETVGYLFSRMRQGKLFELRGDMRREEK